MRYMIAYMLEGNVKTYQLKLMKEISSEFGLKNPSQRIAPHLTLKAPFDADDVSGLEQILERFCNKNSKQEVFINGFGNFNNQVFYLQFQFPEDAKILFRRFNESIVGLDYIQLNPYDEKVDNFHSTMIYAKSNTDVVGIKNYLSNFHPIFKLELDNLSILKKVGRIWEVHKRFRLK